jgi:N-acetylglutamate synthase-like GNAT family acetyltransferase
MSSRFEIIQLAGDSKKLFMLIGPFAMDPKVIRELDGYPILSDEKFVWFIAMDEKQVVSFAALKQHKDHCLFTNDYTDPAYRQKGLHKALLQKRLDWCKDNEIKLIKADCTETCLISFKKAGFKVVKKFNNWTKVEKTL